MAKTILITGANGGLGTTVVESFLNKGYRVIGVSHSERQSDLIKNHPMYEHHLVNVADEAETEQFINKAIASSNTIHAALLLVGSFQPGNILETKGSDLKKMFEVNFESAYYIARPLFKHMMEKRFGRIVLVSSRTAFHSISGRSAIGYTLSKTLLIKLAELLNSSAQGTDVVCSVVAPSTIDTGTNRREMPDADFSKWVQPAQIAELFDFICSDQSAAIREPVYKIYGSV
jgi:NAD(P)-dependent dehydrogenase (short-subunit alcohol dehydrogenase family)